jgi:hypothetical protein
MRSMAEQTVEIYKNIDPKLMSDDAKENMKIALNSLKRFDFEADSSKAAIDKILGNNNISYLKIAHTYRAKNGFGALDLGQLEIRYFPAEEVGQRFVYSTNNK